jgi:beta-lactamase class A
MKEMKFGALVIFALMNLLCCESIAVDQSTLESTVQRNANELFKDIEVKTGGRLGLWALNTANNKKIAYRSSERFPFCSTFKLILTAAILQKSTQAKNLLDESIVISKEEVTSSGYAPITKNFIGKKMSVRELCSAAMMHTDNTASNLLVKKLGGVTEVTNFARSLGDDFFRLDRWEPKLSSSIPGDQRDTTTPESMGLDIYKLTLTNVIPINLKNELMQWMIGNTTGETRIRAGVPAGWKVGDKTGAGGYGTTNDVGIIWPSEKSKPIILSIYFTKTQKNSSSPHEVIAEATKLILASIR